MKMRTLPEAVAILREQDPETAVTLSALRRAVKTGAVPAVMIGTKALVDMDKLETYLSPGKEGEEPPARPITIRPVPEKPLQWWNTP